MEGMHGGTGLDGGWGLLGWGLHLLAWALLLGGAGLLAARLLRGTAGLTGVLLLLAAAVVLVVLYGVGGWRMPMMSSGPMMSGPMMDGGGAMGGRAGASGTHPAASTGAGLSRGAGREVFVRYCGRCHAPPDPSAHTAAEWPTVVARMEGHMRRGGLAAPRGGDRQALLDYLQRHAAGG